MPSVKKPTVKSTTTKTVLKGKVTKRKSLKRSAAFTPKLKQVLTKSELIPEEFDISDLELFESELPEEFDISDPELFESEEEEAEVVAVKHETLINYQQVEDGINKLFEYIAKTTENKTELFDEEQPIFLQIGSIKVPKTPSRQIRLNLKHSLLTENSEVCLIVSDIGKPKEHEETIEHYEQLLKQHGIINIKTIMPFNEFKTEYGKQFELKRKLVGLYDYFLVEGKVCGNVVHLLGRIFLEKRKLPTAVKMEMPNLKQHFEKSLCKTLMKVHSKGDSYAVQIGHTKMSSKDVFENASQIIDELAKKFPGGLYNIRSLGVKTEKSVTVPVYLTLRNKTEVYVPVEHKKMPKHYKPVTGELTTLLERSVTVLPSGEVYVNVIKNNNKKMDDTAQLSDDEDEELADEELSYSDYEEKPSVKIEPVEKNSKKTKNTKVVDKFIKKETDNANEEEDNEDTEILDRAEEMYLNQYEEGQVNIKKEKKPKTAKTKKVSLQKSKKAQVAEVKVTKRAKVATNSKQTDKQEITTKNKKAKVPDKIKQEDVDEAMLTRANVRKTRKPTVNNVAEQTTVSTNSKKMKIAQDVLPLTKPIRNPKESATKKIKQEQVPQVVPKQPQTKKGKNKAPNDKSAENSAAPSTAKPRKTKIKTETEEIPAKKARNAIKIEQSNASPKKVTLARKPQQQKKQSETAASKKNKIKENGAVSQKAVKKTATIKEENTNNKSTGAKGKKTNQTKSKGPVFKTTKKAAAKGILKSKTKK